MEDREFVVNKLSPEITQGIAATLIIIRAGHCVQSGPIFSEPPSMQFTLPTLSTQVRTSMHTEPGHHLPLEMPVSEIKSKPISEDLGLASSSREVLPLSRCDLGVGGHH